ncbi:MAG: right-handed parallel beta-helix repeat-containing protein [Gammaproteobacteria bacterium]|nr:right-handed parallel beta-helix repeat-containing protein [Gammaproteobacteria bacterium]MBT8094355.1 right-handed parallel beta-helix repeat-containing protein [Gammaproteobacteria bacterium]MBT8104428.1 right-handed parallel beta-helix repeat-containing protein [Gammaproteobacteria bacterium]NNK24444.1 right-handed parallel beta-helix repeat-containing protein [Woeseiaceae bacterium]
MKSSHLTTALFLGLILGLWSAGAAAQDPVYVDCGDGDGDSLNDAIRMDGDWGQPLRLYVIGTCYERVTVPRHRVTIDGQPEEGGPIAVLDGTIVNWGSNITIRNITITGAGVGVSASVGRTRLINVDISNNDEEGIVISGGGAVFLNDSRVQHNGLEGVAVETGFLVVNDSVIAGNEVGIDATMGKITLEGTSIVENYGAGVIGRLHTGIVANGPVWIERNGKVGVKLMLDSGLLTSGEVSINDNHWADVACRDRESSARFEDTYPGRVWCSDFRW